MLVVILLIVIRVCVLDVRDALPGVRQGRAALGILVQHADDLHHLEARLTILLTY